PATVRGVFGGLTGVLALMPFAAAWRPTAVLAVLGLGLLATATIAPLQSLILHHAGSAPTLAVAANVGASISAPPPALPSAGPSSPPARCAGPAWPGAYSASAAWP
ncbi:MFS transporter, partial [Streptomyces sp. TRM76130]|nr:MFS transporter [Streptomyces sp. TRM76130]